jgi:hypothetical protein
MCSTPDGITWPGTDKMLQLLRCSTPDGSEGFYTLLVNEGF